MTKKQAAEMEKLRRERNIARALCWPTAPKPEPIEEPERWDQTVAGWSYNLRNRTVRQMWRRGDVWYREDPDRRKNSFLSGTRTAEGLYDTARDAWLAMYHAAAEEYGGWMADMLVGAGLSEGANPRTA